MMKTNLALLFLISLCFAAFSQPKFLEAGALAIIISAVILIILFMIARGFNIQTLEITAKDEFYQLAVAIILLGSFVVIESSLNSMIDGSGGLHKQTEAILNNTMRNLIVTLNNITVYEKASVAGSNIDTCQLFSASFTTTSCGGYSALAPPANTARSIISIILLEHSSLWTLFKLGTSTAMAIIFPMGIFFYSFKFTRQIGIVLIAITFALYIILPLMIVITENVYIKYKEQQRIVYSSELKEPTIDCDPKDSVSQNAKNAIDDFKNMEYYLDLSIEYALIKGLLFPVIYLLSIVSSIRSISALGSIEIDLSAISRLM